MGVERRLVAHGPNLLYPIAEIEKIDFMAAAEVDQVENIHGAGTAPSFVRIKIKIDGVQPAARAVDDGHADQPVFDPVPDLKTAADGGDKKTGVILFGRTPAFGEAGPQEPVKQGQVLPGHGRGGDAGPHITVFLPDPPLITVGAKLIRPQPDRHTILTGWTAHGINAVAVAPIAVGQQPAHGLVINGGEQGLVVNSPLREPVGAGNGDVHKIPFKLGINGRAAEFRPLRLFVYCHSRLPDAHWLS